MPTCPSGSTEVPEGLFCLACGRPLTTASEIPTRLGAQPASAAAPPSRSPTPPSGPGGSHGRFLPGTHIPIFAPERIRETRPDYVFILPWNLKNEIREQLSYIREWSGKFVVPIPQVEVFP